MSDNPKTTKPLDLDFVRTIAYVTLGLQAGALMRQMADEIKRLREENTALRANRQEWRDRAMHTQRELTENLCGR